MPKKTEVIIETYTWPCLSESKAYVTKRVEKKRKKDKDK